MMRETEEEDCSPEGGGDKLEPSQTSLLPPPRRCSPEGRQALSVPGVQS